MVVGGEPLGEARLEQGIVAAVGDHGAQRLEARQEAGSTESIVANHVLSRAELRVKQAQRFRRGVAEALAVVEKGDEFLDAVELDHGVFEA